MDHPGFFENKGPFGIADMAEKLEAELIGETDVNRQLVDIRPLDMAGEGDLSFLDNKKYLSQFRQTRATACIVSPDWADEESSAGVRLVTRDPYRAFAKALQYFYPDAAKPFFHDEAPGAGTAFVHPDAVIEAGAIIEPGAIVGREARIGQGTRLCSGAVIGFRTYIGRDCLIGPNASLTHSLLGNEVIIHQGTSIGQDGFGFAMGPQGHLKVPQIGRVVIQDRVEIGANTTIDRGALKDTVIGEGTKVDNLVQIGHNCQIGRNCVIVAQVGISGSTVLEDFVVFGGQGAAAGHVTIGMGAKIAANGKVSKDIPAGAVVGGAPAMPIKQWKKEIIALRRLASGKLKL